MLQANTLKNLVIADEGLGARNGGSGMYTKYMSILSTAQQRNSSQEKVYTS